MELERWQLGRHTFHRPQRTLSATPRLTTIEGRIRHAGHSLRMSRECALWLALLFDRALFRRLIMHSVSLGWTAWPLLALKQAGWALTRGWRSYAVRRCTQCTHLFLALRQPFWALRCPTCDAAAHARALAATGDDLPF